MKKSIPLWIVILLVFISLAAGAVAMKLAEDLDAPSKNYIDTQSSTNQLSEQDAKKIALDKAGLAENEVVFERTEQDYENGILVYEIEFRQGRTEYSAEISVADGTIVSWEVDTQ